MIFVDAHVHLHDNFHVREFFECAAANFRKASSEMGDGHPLYVIALTESFPTNRFGNFYDFAGNGVCPKGGSGGSVRLARTLEDSSLLCTLNGETSLILIAGRQIISAEGLEVLALGTKRMFPDGRPLARVLLEVRDSGALPVIPWGFGKWSGARGRLVKELLLAYRPEAPLFLGDNGGRPCLLPEPSFFELARRQGVPILPGSDPFPFPREVRRVGSFGFACPCSLSCDQPTRDLTRALTDPASTLIPYGRLEHPLPFIGKQVAIQMIKRGILKLGGRQ